MLENRGTPANLAKCAMTMGKTSAKRQPSMQSIRGFETSDQESAASDDLTPCMICTNACMYVCMYVCLPACRNHSQNICN